MEAGLVLCSTNNQPKIGIINLHLVGQIEATWAPVPGTIVIKMIGVVFAMFCIVNFVFCFCFIH